MESQFQKKLLQISLMLLAIFAFGTIGYVLIEGNRLDMDWFDAFYMTIITLTTIGFGEIPGELSVAGRSLTILLAFFGMGTLLYVVSNVTAFFVEGHLNQILTRRKMEKIIRDMQHHYIVCGSDMMASHIAEELRRTRQTFMVLDDNEEALRKMAEEREDLLYMVGDPSDDDTLREAGVTRAAGLVTVKSSDQENIFNIITARRLNDRLRIISLAVAESSIPKLQYAGADGVVSPNFIGSMRMVSELIRPATVTFLDRMLKDKNHDWRIGEAVVTEQSSIVGKSLRELRPTRNDKLLVLGVQPSTTEEMLYVPDPDRQFQPGDTVFVLAAAKDLKRLQKETGTKRP